MTTLAKFGSRQLWTKELLEDATVDVVGALVSSMENMDTMRRLETHPFPVPNEKERALVQRLFDMTFHEEEDTCCECGQSVPIDWAERKLTRERYGQILNRRA